MEGDKEMSLLGIKAGNGKETVLKAGEIVRTKRNVARQE